ncbi:MAG TPA: SDR family NAD(P)-dependent oxidoreductase [Dongiaceae bacterium]|nr:SDR family NAD(P)-dependent oxidoreductase [Dongiaceae bacterium]
MTTRTALILGGTSAIAEAVARLFAAEGMRLLLVGRSAGRLQAIASDLTARGASSVEIETVDLVAETAIHAVFDRLVAKLGGRVDYALICHGYLGDQPLAERDQVEAGRILSANFSSAALWALTAAGHLRRQGHGSLVVLGSVAGDRGRRANFVYGAAKAGIATLCEGIAHEFAATGPKAVIVKIGPTDTPMTDGFDKRGVLWSKPEKVASIIRRAADGKSPVVYAPGFWRWIMMIIKAIPAPIFNRMSF